MSKDTFDLYSLDGADRTEIISGIMKDVTENSLAGKLFGAGEEVGSLNGSMPYFPSKKSIVNGDNHGSSKVAIGAEPNKTRGGLQSAAYKFSHKYALEGSVLKAEILNLKRINSAELLFDFLLRLSLARISFDIDQDLKTVLDDTNANEIVVATAAWSNNTTARPITDVLAMHDKGAAEYNTVVIGMDKVRELATLDTFKAMSQNYTGTGSIEDSRASQGAVVQFLFKELAGIENVVVGNTWYDQNGSAGALNVGRLFDGTVWMGDKEHLKMLKVSDLDEGEQGYNPRTQKYYAFQNVHALIMRLEKAMGCTLTGS